MTVSGVDSVRVRVCGVPATAVALELHASREIAAMAEGRQPRLGVASPSSAPFVGVGTAMGTTMVEFSEPMTRVLEGHRPELGDGRRRIGLDGRATQPKVSALRDYKLAGFSVERLMNLLTALDQDVQIVIRRKPRSWKTGRISVVAA